MICGMEDLLIAKKDKNRIKKLFSPLLYETEIQNPQLVLFVTLHFKMFVPGMYKDFVLSEQKKMKKNRATIGEAKADRLIKKNGYYFKGFSNFIPSIQLRSFVLTVTKAKSSLESLPRST